MNRYYVSTIIQNKDDKRAWLCSITDCVLSIEKAIELVEFMRRNHTVLSAWVDCFDKTGSKIVFHECYVDVLGQVDQVR